MHGMSYFVDILHILEEITEQTFPSGLRQKQGLLI